MEDKVLTKKMKRKLISAGIGFGVGCCVSATVGKVVGNVVSPKNIRETVVIAIGVGCLGGYVGDKVGGYYEKYVESCFDLKDRMDEIMTEMKKNKAGVDIPAEQES